MSETKQKELTVLEKWESIKHTNPSFLTQNKEGKSVEINVVELVKALQSKK